MYLTWSGIGRDQPCIGKLLEGTALGWGKCWRQENDRVEPAMVYGCAEILDMKITWQKPPSQSGAA